MKRPVDFVSACSAVTVNGLTIPTALGFGNHDTEVSATLGTGSSKVYSHEIKLALPMSPFKSAFKFVTGGGSVKGRFQHKARLT